MIVLLDTNRKQWDGAPAELGSGMDIGQLVTPAPGFSDYGADVFAIDNSFYSHPDVNRFRAIMKRQESRRDKCLFVAVPDAPFSARRTREVFGQWAHQLRGWPLAYVTQNGQDDVAIPWCEIKALFIGGDDDHKDGPEGTAAARAAIAFEKHLHFGRVNGIERAARVVKQFGHYPKLSIDGSGISKYTHMRVKLGRAIRGEEEPGLFTEESSMNTPASIVNDEGKYKPAAWEQYTVQELGNWVHLLIKRSGMRSDPAKAVKDLADAQAYLDMIQEHINERKKG